MRKANSNVISNPIRAVVPPSVKPWRPAVPKMAPTIPLTMPLRMRPAPSAASQPSTTLTQLVPLSSSRGANPEVWPERTSRSATLGASVLPCLSVICLLLCWWSRSYIRVGLLGWTFGLCQGAIVEQSGQHPPDDRPKYVEPHASEVPRNDHRSQG